MAHYVITPRPDTPLVCGIRVPFSDLISRVRQLSGREPGAWLTKSLHRTGKCYVATAPGSTGRDLYGQGFIVHYVNESENS